MDTLLNTTRLPHWGREVSFFSLFYALTTLCSSNTLVHLAFFVFLLTLIYVTDVYHIRKYRSLVLNSWAYVLKRPASIFIEGSQDAWVSAASSVSEDDARSGYEFPRLTVTRVYHPWESSSEQIPTAGHPFWEDLFFLLFPSVFPPTQGGLQHLLVQTDVQVWVSGASVHRLVDTYLVVGCKRES